MARTIPAKRASRANPREDRNRSNRQQPANDEGRFPVKRAIRTNLQKYEEDSARFKGKSVSIIPKSLAQEQYLDALEDKRNSIVIASGPAGTGKSYLATLFAIRSY